MTLQNEKDLLITKLENQVSLIDLDLQSNEKFLEKIMNEVEHLKEKRQSTLCLLHEIKKIKS